MHDQQSSTRQDRLGDPSDEQHAYQDAPTGTDIECKRWRQEAALRMLSNNLDPKVTEHPEDLVVYSGTGRIAHSWDAYDAILTEPRDLDDDETLLAQSDKPVGTFPTHERVPRILIANSDLIGRWDDWEHFCELEAKGKTMYGQMAAGSWAYIGTQGIIQGAYETLAEPARQRYDTDLRRKLVVTGGLDGMSGVQPLAVTMNCGVCITTEMQADRIEHRVETDYLMEFADSLDKALENTNAAIDADEPYSVDVQMNAADMLEGLLTRDKIPDVVADQTSAHDELKGHYPSDYTVVEADRLHESDPEGYVDTGLNTMERHVQAILDLQDASAVASEYSNSIRGQVQDRHGVTTAFDFPSFAPTYIRPMFCRGCGSFQWATLSGDPADTHRTDKAIRELFPERESFIRQVGLAQEQVSFQGLPSHVCWLGYATDDEELTERVRFALKINDLVVSGEVPVPVVVTHDHLDAGPIANPCRKTEVMRDDTDAVADWPILNALLNTAAGTDIVNVRDGGGVGIGNSLHANNHVVLDDSDFAMKKARAVSTTDPGMDIIRHTDAGYEGALDEATRSDARIPIRNHDAAMRTECPEHSEYSERANRADRAAEDGGHAAETGESAGRGDE